MVTDLDNSPADILASYLIGTGVVLKPPTTPIQNNDFQWYCYTSTKTIDGNNSVITYDTVGRIDGRQQRGGKTVEHNGIKILVRAMDYFQGWRQIRTICYLIDQILGTIVTTPEGYVYNVAAVSRRDGPTHAGTEEKGRREVFSANFLMAVDELEISILNGDGGFCILYNNFQDQDGGFCAVL